MACQALDWHFHGEAQNVIHFPSYPILCSAASPLPHPLLHLSTKSIPGILVLCYSVPCSPKFAPSTSTTGVTWKLVRNADAMALPQIY